MIPKYLVNLNAGKQPKIWIKSLEEGDGGAGVTTKKQTVLRCLLLERLSHFTHFKQKWIFLICFCYHWVASTCFSPSDRDETSQRQKDGEEEVQISGTVV